MDNGRADVLVKMNLNKMYSSFPLRGGWGVRLGQKKSAKKRRG